MTGRMPALAWRVGDRVRVRGRRWKVGAISRGRDCSALVLCRDEAPAEDDRGRLTVLVPFDRPTAIERRLAPQVVRPRRWIHAANRILLDTHPLVPTATSVRAALDQLADRLSKAGAKVARASPLLPDLAAAGRLYTRLLWSFLAAFWPIDLYRGIEAGAKALPESDNSLAAWQARGIVLSHRDWVASDRERAALRKRWQDLFGEWDVVLCPPMPTPAFPHDHTSDQRARRIDIDGTPHPYLDQIMWPSIATVAGLPATAMPIGISDTGLPIGVQIIGPFLEDRTPLQLAQLIEREFGGFVAPPEIRG